MLKTVLTGGLLSAAIVLMVQDDGLHAAATTARIATAVGPDVIVGSLRGLSTIHP